MAITTTSDLNGLFNTIYDDAVFTARERTLMTQLVTVKGAVGYAQRKVPKYASIAAQEKPEGVDYAGGGVLSKSNMATFSPSVKMAQTLLTDEDMATDPDDARTSAAVELGNAMAEKVDKDLLNRFASFSTQKGTANASLTLANCAAALAVIRTNKAIGAAYAVLHPYQWHDIWVLLGAPATNMAFLGEAANAAMKDYYVVRHTGMDWFTSANITVDSSDDATGGVFTRDAIALDIREAMSLEPERDASRKAWEMNLSMGYAEGTLWTERGVKIISDATEPT
jgi:hypothetical protein